MAARASSFEDFKRSAASSVTDSGSSTCSKPDLVGATSSLSLEENISREDIDLILNRNWHLEEVIIPIRDKLAFLSGGRDKRGGPILTIQPGDRSDVGPINIGKLMAYYRKIPSPSVQSLGFTIILDSRQTSWHVAKVALKSLQHTFVEHIFQVLVIKPKSFWKRPRLGTGLTLRRAKYSFSIRMLDIVSDLLQLLPASQITRDLGGTLAYNHEKWIDFQKSLEKHVLSLQGRLEDFDFIQVQMEEEEEPQDLESARDAVRRHVETKQLLEKVDLDIACDAVGHTVSKLLPCENPDFLACFSYLEELCSQLQDTRNKLEYMWGLKGSKLDKLLQIRLFESESNKIEAWLQHEVGVLAQEHTAIGDCLGAAQMKKAAFSEYKEKFKMKYQELSHMIGMGDKLVAAHHFAREQIQRKLDELQEKWDVLRGVVEERVELLDLSVSFQDSQQKFFQNVESWLDDCQSKDKPSDTSGTEDALTHHKLLKESCNGLYSTVQREGMKIVEKLRMPVGDSSLPTGFVMGTRHIKEILESLYDERSWIDEQWAKRQVLLTRQLNLCKFQDKAEKVYNWFSDTGKPFLSSFTSIGRSEDDTSSLLHRHESFEASTQETYALADRLRELTAQLSSSKQCEPEEIAKEEAALQGAVDGFTSQMDARKNIILHAMDYFKKLNELEDTLNSLSSPLPKANFHGPSEVIEPLMRDFQAQCTRAKEMAASVHQHCVDLQSMLRAAAAEALSMGVLLDYVEAKEELVEREERGRGRQGEVWQACDWRERRLDLTIQLNQFERDVKEHNGQVELWIEDQDNDEWDHAPNIIEAKLRLDAFQKDYDQLYDAYQELVTRGRGVASNICQLEQVMFGDVESGHAHPVVQSVEETLAEAGRVNDEMDGLASDQLQVLRDCYQYYRIKQTSSKLTSCLTELSTAILHLTGIGRSLDEATAQHNKVSEAQRTLDDVKKQVAELQREVSICVEQGRYGSSVLNEEVGAVLQNRLTGTEQQVEKRMIVASTMLDFHRNMKNLRESFDECETEFSSKETGASVPEIEQQLRGIVERKVFIEQATEVVLSQGCKAQSILVAPRSRTRGIKGQDSFPSTISEHPDELQSSGSTPMLEYTSAQVRRAQSSEDLLESCPLRNPPSATETALYRTTSQGDMDNPSLHNHVQTHPSSSSTSSPDPQEGAMNTTTLNRTKSLDLLNSYDRKSPESGKLQTPSSDMPKLLVSPKRTSKSALKPAQSVPSIAAVDKDRKTMENYLEEMKSKLKQIMVLWEKRKTRLAEAKKAKEFMAAVPGILEWVESVGAEFFNKHDHYGRSIVEVKKLLQSCTEFEQTKVVEMSEKVRKLMTLYRSIQGMPEVRVSYSSLQNRWDTFEKEVRKLVSNMELALKFHEGMLTASRWCQTTMIFLDKIYQRAEEISRSEEASELVLEVHVYMGANEDEQKAQIDQLKHFSFFLTNFQLSQLADSINHTTEDTISEYKACKGTLEELQKHFQRKEGEKDRVEKLTRKRERVLGEMLATEEAYVNDLRLVVERFRPRFVNDFLPNTLKGKEDVIFGNVHMIQKFHKTFFLPLMQENEGRVDELAGLFVDSLEEMTALYMPFCQGKSASEELLAHHRTYLHRVQSMFGIETPLSTLLIKPVQRITKYPLLLKDILKYTDQLGQPTTVIKMAVEATGKLLQATNNAVHIFHLENYKELTAGLGDLLYQSTLHVSGSRFGVKGERERNVFCFEHALLFTRKVELLQGPDAAFKYEFKSKTPISHKLQMVEFVEAEPTKFLLVTGDHKLHFKATTLDEKQQWVRVLRSAIMNKCNDVSKLNIPSVAVPSLTPSPTPGTSGKETPNGMTDFKKMNGSMVVPVDRTHSKASPYASPQPMRKRSMSEEMLLGPPTSGGEQRQRSLTPTLGESDMYMVTMDYPPEPTDDYLELCLKKGDIVQVLDQHSGGRWFVRASMGAGAFAHGWFPSEHLQCLSENEAVDETDSKDSWVQITAGPLSGTSDEHNGKKPDKDRKAFGSHDLQSLNVISNLKKVTIALEGGVDVVGVPEDDMGEESSLDFSSLDVGPASGRQFRSNTLPSGFSSESPTMPPATPTDMTTLVHPPLPLSPSPHTSPQCRRRSKTESAILTSPLQSSTEDSFRKSQFRRKNVIKVPTRKKKKGAVQRNASVGSENSVGVASTEGGEVEEVRSERIPSSSGSSDALNQSRDSEGAKLSDAAEVPLEEEAERLKRMKKIEYIMAEIKQTEQTFVQKLEDCVKIYLNEMKSPALPEQLKGKETTIFGNLPALFAFHKDTFLKALEKDGNTVEGIGKCFIDSARHFEKFVTYSENKIKSESFLWTYRHDGGIFFEELRDRHGQRQGIDSLLIKPIQRMSMYKLLLSDLQKSSKKAGLDTPLLDKAVQLTLDVPRRANDAMTLSSIYGYDGNIHKHGQLLLQDVFVVYERSRRAGVRRQLFLLEQRLVITKEKDADGLYVFKDALRVYSLSVAEKEGDEPNRFAVGTGTVGEWDQYYLLEAPTVEKKQEWLEALKDIMKGQFDLLKALASTSPNPYSHSSNLEPISVPKDNAVAMIAFSDDSDQEFEELGRECPLSAISCPNPGVFSPAHLALGKTDNTVASKHRSSVIASSSDPEGMHLKSRKFNLYIVAEDCAPPKDDEGIIYIHKGQIFDVLDSSSEWWLARLVRDVLPKSPQVCEQGWVPGSFLDKFDGQLSREEEEFIWTEYQKRQEKQLYGVSKTPSGRMQVPPGNNFHTLPLPHKDKKKKKKMSFVGPEVNGHVKITSTFSYQADVEMRETKKAQQAILIPKAPSIVTPLTDQIVSEGHRVRFQCQIQEDTHPLPNVEWNKDGQQLVINRAFFSVTEKTVQLRFKDADLEDEGEYSCILSNDLGTVKTTARLTVTGPPSMPGPPSVKILGPDSVQLSWTPPTLDGHSPITNYVVECRDIASNRWSSIMQRVPEPSTKVTDMMPANYMFRVFAINQHGSGRPSKESANVNLLPMRQTKPTEYSLEPFEDKYNLLQIIGRGQFGTVFECAYKVTQQVYACKLLPLEVGRDHAQHELEMLCDLDHPNIVQITDSYLTHQHFILVFHKVGGASLIEYFAHHENLSDPLCALSVEQAFQGLLHLHQLGIGHFSIRPQNVMAVEMLGQPLPQIKLIHFERARKITSSLILRMIPDIDFEAPEILRERPVSTAADVWSIGAFVYSLYSGFSPYHSDSLDLTKENILNNHYTFSMRKPFTEPVKDFIKKLLVKDTSMRLTCEQALNHSWFEIGRVLFNDPLAKYPKLSVQHIKTALSRESWSTSRPLLSQPFTDKLIHH